MVIHSSTICFCGSSKLWVMPRQLAREIWIEARGGAKNLLFAVLYVQ